MTTPATTTTKGAWLARRARPLLAAYALLLLVVLLSPTSTVQAELVFRAVDALQLLLPDSWVDFTRAEVALNAVIIAPLSFLGSLVFRRWRWQEWTAYGFLGAIAVELFQGLVLPGREASLSDIVSNGLGALLGALLAHLWVRRSSNAE